MKTVNLVQSKSGERNSPLKRILRAFTLLAITAIFLFSLALSAQNPKLWGVAPDGGANNNGVIFEYDPLLNTVTVKHHFDRHTNGSNPVGGLIQADNGMLYGLGQNGLTDNLGVLYEYNPFTNIYTVKHDFKDDGEGSSPTGILLQASDGKLYGLAGVIFRYDIATGTYTKLYDFPPQVVNGIASTPFGNLIEGANGKLYGMAQDGGANNDGVIFEFDLTTNTYSQKFDFDHFVTGGFRGRMVNTPFGIYGTKSGGGPNNRGTIFTYDPVNNLYTVIYDFDENDNTGQVPLGEVLLANNGLFYGVNEFGGVLNDGILFQLDRSNNTVIQKHDFDESDKTGKNPNGSLMQASNGKIYGMTQYGGQDGNGDPVNDGVIFEFDPAGNVISKSFYFNGNNGKNPYRSKLIEVDFTPPPVQAPISIVSNASWMQSTVVATLNANTYPWLGPNSLPPANTFTQAPDLGQPYPWEHIYSVEGSQVIQAGGGITFFRKTFELTANANLKVRFRMFVDDNLEIFINGHSMAREQDIGVENFRTVNHDILFASDGSATNGNQGGDPFDVFNTQPLDNIFQVGTNEVILAIRNRTTKPDKGGFSFRMDVEGGAGAEVFAKTNARKNNTPRPLISNFEVFPNPTTGIVNIIPQNINGAQDLELHVFDMGGQLLIKKSRKDIRQGDPVRLDLSALGSGIYNIRININQTTTVERVILH